MLDEIGDPVGNDARLAAARARQNEHRSIDSFNGLALLRIQLVEKGQSRKWLRSLLFILQDTRDARFVCRVKPREAAGHVPQANTARRGLRKRRQRNLSPSNFFRK